MELHIAINVENGIDMRKQFNEVKMINQTLRNRMLAITSIRYMMRVSRIQIELTNNSLLVRQEGNRSVRRNMSHDNLDIRYLISYSNWGVSYKWR